MGLAYNGSFKKLLILLAITTLVLLTYSIRYQSSWLSPSDKQTLENKSKSPNFIHLLQHSDERDVSFPGSHDPVIRRSKVNNTLPKQVQTQRVILTNTGQRSSTHERAQDDNKLGNYLVPVSHPVPHPWFTSPPTAQPVQDLLGNKSQTQGELLPKDLFTQGPSAKNSLTQEGQLVKDSLNQKHGYIVVLSIYEQQTMASGNLLQLQCWANFLNLAVVKPFMQSSSLETPLDTIKQNTKLRMEDTFDMQKWNQYTSDVGYAPLVEWEEFIKFAPRKLIVVHIKYPTLTQVKAIKEKGLPFPHPPTEERLYAQDCKFKFSQSKGMASLQRKGFVIVRKVCLNFLTGDKLPLKQLQEHIFSEYKDDQVSLIINEWRGLGESQRVLIQEEMCLEEKAYREHTTPSAKIFRDSERYINQYLQQFSTETGDSQTLYIAVMARYEMTGLTKRLNNQDDPHAIIPVCLEETLRSLENMKASTKIPSVFLSMDVGRYGSESFQNKHYFGHLKDMEEFVGKVYNGKMTIRDWEKTFETISHTQDSGYIGMLQLVLVTKAKCILFVGGGTFQRHALHLYQDLHPDPKDRCVRIIDKCTSPYRPVVK